MSSYEAFVTKSASSGQSGILPPSLLESASLSAPLDDNSALTSMQNPSRYTSGSDLINSESERLLSSDITASGDKNTDSNQSIATNYTPQLAQAFNSNQSFNTPQIPTNIPLLQTSSTLKNSNFLDEKDPLTGNTAASPLVSTNAQDQLTGNALTLERTLSAASGSIQSIQPQSSQSQSIQPQSILAQSSQSQSIQPQSILAQSSQTQSSQSQSSQSQSIQSQSIQPQSSQSQSIQPQSSQSQSSQSQSSQSQSIQSQSSQSPTPNFAIRTEGTISINNGGDFDGNPKDLSDDALIYAAKGFTINNNPTLPVQIDSAGNPIHDSSGKLVLVDLAVAVSSGYTVTNGPSNQYAGLIPPQVIPQQTVNVPAYADVKQLELTRRIPSGTPTVTFNISQNPINNANDWSSKFPPPGTATNPTVVKVIGGGLNIPLTILRIKIHLLLQVRLNLLL